MRRIFEVGLYREIGGGQAEITVIDEKNGFALGRASEGSWNAYSLDGGLDGIYDGDQFDLDGPWTPTPPDGFALCDRDLYRAKEGDQVCFCGQNSWCLCDSYIGKTATEYDEMFPRCAPHWFATPVAATTESTPGWKPTLELQYRDCKYRSQIPENTTAMFVDGKRRYVVLEQKWSNGTDFEWREIPIVKE